MYMVKKIRGKHYLYNVVGQTYYKVQEIKGNQKQILQQAREVRRVQLAERAHRKEQSQAMRAGSILYRTNLKRYFVTRYGFVPSWSRLTKKERERLESIKNNLAKKQRLSRQYHNIVGKGVPAAGTEKELAKQASKMEKEIRRKLRLKFPKKYNKYINARHTLRCLQQSGANDQDKIKKQKAKIQEFVNLVQG